MSKTIERRDGKLVVKFSVPTVEFNKLLVIVKSIGWHRFDPKLKAWLLEDTEYAVKKLTSYGFVFPGEEKQTSVGSDDKWDIPPLKIAEIDASKLDPRLYAFQRDGVGFLEANNGSGILAYEVGCGKTLTSLSYVNLHSDNLPCLILCPSAVKTNWEREIKHWVNKKSIKLYGTVSHPVVKSSFVIINYDIIHNSKYPEKAWIEYLKHYKFQSIICDECHYLKNTKAKRTKAFLKLVKDIPKRIFLSGTIVKNRTSDLYVPLHCLNPVQFSNEYKFLNRFCDPKYTPWGIVHKGLTNADELLYHLSPLMHHIKKRDVLKDLPDRATYTVALEADAPSMKKYTRASEAFLEWCSLSTEKRKASEGNQHFEELRTWAYLSKREALIEWVSDFIDSGEKLVLFAVHTKAIDDLAEAFKGRCLVIDGRTKGDRQLIVDEFAKEEYPLLIGQTEACGTGLNLQVASNVAMCESVYSLSTIEQCRGRVDRIGSKADKVVLWHLICLNTIDEDIILLLEEKREIVDAIMNGGNKSDIYGMDVADLIMKLYRDKLRRRT